MSVKVLRVNMASKEKCWLVWVSFGIFMSVQQFVDRDLMVQLQGICKFFYDKAVSRV